MRMTFNDNAEFPIIAIDFDGTINIENTYPDIGQFRKYAKEVINFMYDIGIKVVIWTSRDMGIDHDGHSVYDDITPMILCLNANGIKYSAINRSIQFSPFHYQGRKIYAHMYVDDRAYGFDSEDEDIMLKVMKFFLHYIVDIPHSVVYKVMESIEDGEEISDDIRSFCTDCVKIWKIEH